MSELDPRGPDPQTENARLMNELVVVKNQVEIIRNISEKLSRVQAEAINEWSRKYYASKRRETALLEALRQIAKADTGLEYMDLVRISRTRRQIAKAALDAESEVSDEDKEYQFQKGIAEVEAQFRYELEVEAAEEELTSTTECSHCKGEGVWEAEHVIFACKHCNGLGRISESEVSDDDEG